MRRNPDSRSPVIESFFVDDMIPVVFHRPPRGFPEGIVLCLHGLLSHKDSAKFVQICNEAAIRGFLAVRFDQAGAGENRMPLLDGLIPDRLRSIDRVMGFVRKSAGDLPVFLLGSSLGGYLAFLYAAQNRRIQALASWAAPFDVHPVAEVVKERFAVPLGRPMSLGDVPEMGSTSKALIIHGRADNVVPPDEGYRIYEKIGFPKKLVFVHGADHRFLHERGRLLAIRLSLEWFRSANFLCRDAPPSFMNDNNGGW
ncbi:alpha/beta hydrolase [Thermodesulforhabdus norvegica]|uniref:Lysophospholipase, alpha-beta hydrolase superfamily n=1 Tax=Thermodesulforhabdus norvegica TaxID=39841 RepID=A0A1I4QH46_9BACT|nr:alpha/beta fold hydrolase [Thermodesulforhabdus norvegica]SFM39398.1 Lysophospholipase, alpha-beta hydrolase superfamily [Thermodesulforhabdus norvegica]